MDKKEIQALDRFIATAKVELNQMVNTISKDALVAAADLIADSCKAGNRVHVSGIGKPSHVAEYIAALFSSVGTPCYALDGTEAVHGSSGQTRPGDVVIFISNSGETAEMKAALLTVKANGCKIIGVSGRQESWLKNESDAFLFAGVTQEGGPLNRAPRLSVLDEIIVLQAVSVLLQEHSQISPQQYVKWHPGGTLGKLRDYETEGDGQRA